jgi:hypothetical protein
MSKIDFNNMKYDAGMYCKFSNNFLNNNIETNISNKLEEIKMEIKNNQLGGILKLIPLLKNI